MFTIAALILMLTNEVVLGQDHRVAVEGQTFTLDMALESVDDRYVGCTENMAKLVETKYLEKEKNESSSFKTAWQEGEEKCQENKDNLTKIHLIAVYVYTGCKVYKEFNRNCSIGKQQYITGTYKWYSLHFLLTKAIQILSKTQQKCRLTFRGTELEFDENVLNTEVRFGFFASSSLDQNVAVRFGNKSCFEIYTCEGADVTNYSKFSDENEVLIPPYEMFIVTAIINRRQHGAWCKTVFRLNSSGIISNLNCAVKSAHSQIYPRYYYLWLAGPYFLYLIFISPFLIFIKHLSNCTNI